MILMNQFPKYTLSMARVSLKVVSLWPVKGSSEVYVDWCMYLGSQCVNCVFSKSLLLTIESVRSFPLATLL